MIPSNNQKALRISKDYIQSISEELISKGKSGKQFSDNFSSLQFMTVNLDHHPRFKKFIHLVHEGEAHAANRVQDLNVISLLASNKKVSFHYELVSLEDYLSNLITEDLTTFEYASATLENREIVELFRGAYERDYKV